MIRARDLAILTLAICMFMVSNYVMLPINSILGVPSVVLIVGLFLGVLRGYSRYVLYVFSILACVPEMYIEYQKDLITNRAIMEIYIRSVYGRTETPTVSEPSILSNIIMIGFFAFIFVYFIKYISMNYKKIFSSIKLILIMVSLPMLIMFLPMFVALPAFFIWHLNPITMLTDTGIDMLVQLSVILVLLRSIVIAFFGPIYGYYVFKSINLYKRLGLEN